MATKSLADDQALQDSLKQDLSTAMKDLTNTFTSAQDNMEKISAMYKRISDKDDDIGQAEMYKALMAKFLQAGFDNTKMIQADEKFVGLSLMVESIAEQRQVRRQNEELHKQRLSHQDQLHNAYLIALTDERVQKSAIRTPEIQK